MVQILENWSWSWIASFLSFLPDTAYIGGRTAGNTTPKVLLIWIVKSSHSFSSSLRACVCSMEQISIRVNGDHSCQIHSELGEYLPIMLNFELKVNQSVFKSLQMEDLDGDIQAYYVLAFKLITIAFYSYILTT